MVMGIRRGWKDDDDEWACLMLPTAACFVLVCFRSCRFHGYVASNQHPPPRSLRIAHLMSFSLELFLIIIGAASHYSPPFSFLPSAVHSYFAPRTAGLLPQMRLRGSRQWRAEGVCPDKERIQVPARRRAAHP